MNYSIVQWVMHLALQCLEQRIHSWEYSKESFSIHKGQTHTIALMLDYLHSSTFSSYNLMVIGYFIDFHQSVIYTNDSECDETSNLVKS